MLIVNAYSYYNVAMVTDPLPNACVGSAWSNFPEV